MLMQPTYDAHKPPWSAILVDSSSDGCRGNQDQLYGHMQSCTVLLILQEHPDSIAIDPSLTGADDTQNLTFLGPCSVLEVL